MSSKMSCCVPFCKNSTENINKSDGIRFIDFPGKGFLRSAWLLALGMEGRVAAHAVVCTRHFLREDLLCEARSDRLLRAGAVPTTIQVCLICLDTDSKMFSMAKYNLEDAYEHLTGYTLCDEGNLKHILCVECTQRLMNFYKFRDKSLRARSLMHDLVEKHEVITINHIEQLSDARTSLKSNLACSKLLENPCNPIMLEDSADEQTDLKTESSASEPDFSEDAHLEPDLQVASDRVDAQDEDKSNVASVEDIPDEYIVEEHIKRTLNGQIPVEHTPDDYIADQDIPEECIPDEDIIVERILDDDVLDVYIPDENISDKRIADEDVTPDEHIQDQHTADGDISNEDIPDEDILEEEILDGNILDEDILEESTLDEDTQDDYISDDDIQIGNTCSVGLTRDKCNFDQEFRKVMGLPLNSTECSAEPSHKISYGDHPGYQVTRRSNRYPRGNRSRHHRASNAGGRPNQIKLRSLHNVMPSGSGPQRSKQPNSARPTTDALLATPKQDDNEKMEIIMKTKSCSSNNNINEGQRFICDLCSRLFQQKILLEEHIISHTKPRLYKCNICKFQSKYGSNLVKHAMTHTGEKPFSCELCKYKCTKKCNLERHMRSHTGVKPYECEFCEFKCTIKTNLMSHMRTHTGEKPYACKFCQYRCSQSSTLASHTRTHVLEKPYVCELCQYKCAKKSNLTRHFKSHPGYKPYACKLCQYKCSQSSTLARHMRTHATDKPYDRLCRYKNSKKSKFSGPHANSLKT